MPPKPFYWEPRGMKQIKGLSGLFPGPVVDKGKRAWDWNPNSRWSAEQRYYAGFEGAAPHGALHTEEMDGA